MAAVFVCSTASWAPSQTTESAYLRVGPKNLHCKQIPAGDLKNFKKCCSRGLRYSKLPGMPSVRSGEDVDAHIHALVAGKPTATRQCRGSDSAYQGYRCVGPTRQQSHFQKFILQIDLYTYEMARVQDFSWWDC